MIDAVVVRRFLPRIPLGMIVPMFLIIGIGVLNLSSAARATRPELYLAQLSKFVFALGLMLVTAVIHTRIVRRVAFISLLVAVVLLLAVLIVGTWAKGGQRWLVFGGLRLQPSDPAKIAVVLALARYCSIYWPEKGYSILSLTRPFNVSRPLGFLLGIVALLIKARHGSELLSSQLLTSKLGVGLMCGVLIFGLAWLLLSLYMLSQGPLGLTSFIAPIDVVIVPFLLICVEPDLATGLIVLSTAGIMFLYVGIQRSSLLIALCLGIGVGVFSYFYLLKDYQKQRIVSFLNQEADVQGQGYQAMQSIIAIGSGRAIGKGFNGGTQTQLSFLPENATDFVFSVWAEEWGFIACVFLLFLYFLLISTVLRLANKVDDKFSQLVCVGISAHIFAHVLINVSMVTGLMPVAGVPLPLMSYGGSSMTTTLIGLGLVLNVAFFRGAK